MLQSERGRELSQALREQHSKVQARAAETLLDIPQLTFDDFQDNE